MKDLIIQIGEDYNGVYLLNVLKTVPGHNIRGVICTDQKEQVERLKAVLPEGTELAAGTSRARASLKKLSRRSALSPFSQ